MDHKKNKPLSFLCLNILMLITLFTNCSAPTNKKQGSFTRTSSSTPIKTLSISSLNRVQPDDVLAEVTYYQGGSPGPTCSEGYIPVVVSTLRNEIIELRGYLSSATCGWQPNEFVKVTIQLPNGQQYYVKKQANLVEDGYIVSIEYETDLDDPSGIYTFIFEGNSGMVKDSVLVQRPDGPRFYREDNRIWFLYNFSPNEHIRLFIYNGQGNKPGYIKFVGWEKLEVDSNGQLRIKIPENELTIDAKYAVIGNISGAVSEFGPAGINPQRTTNHAEESNTKRGNTSSCIQTSQQRLEIGKKVRVCTENARLIVRSQPGSDNTEITRLNPGSYINIIDGPICTDNYIWWKIQTDSGTTGWVAEGNNSNNMYYICPIE